MPLYEGDDPKWLDALQGEERTAASAQFVERLRALATAGRLTKGEYDKLSRGSSRLWLKGAGDTAIWNGYQCDLHRNVRKNAGTHVSIAIIAWSWSEADVTSPSYEVWPCAAAFRMHSATAAFRPKTD